MTMCELCGEPMPLGEEMFKYHGYSGPCPKPPLPKPVEPDWKAKYTESQASLDKTVGELQASRSEAADLAIQLQAANEATRTANETAHEARLALEAELQKQGKL